MSESRRDNGETARNLTSGERQALFDASKNLLSSWGVLMGPPGKRTTYDESGNKTSEVSPWRQVSVPPQKLAIHGLDFSVLLLRTLDVNPGIEGIRSLTMQARRQLISEESVGLAFGMLKEKPWWTDYLVALERNDEDEVFVSEEATYAFLLDTEIRTIRVEGVPIEMSQTRIKPAPPLSRQDLLHITAAMNLM